MLIETIKELDELAKKEGNDDSTIHTEEDENVGIDVDKDDDAEGGDDEKAGDTTDDDKEEEADAGKSDGNKDDTKKDEEKTAEPDKKLEGEGKKENEGAVYFKLREEARKREAAEAETKRLKEELERKAAKPIPDKEENFEGHVDARIETAEQRLARLEQAEAARQERAEVNATIQSMVQTFVGFENEFKTSVPDYDARSDFVAARLKQNIRFENPHYTEQQLAQHTMFAMLKRGEIALAQGRNPAADIYNQAESLGYTPKAREEEKKAPPKDVRKEPDLDKVAINKKKTSGMANGGGGGDQGISHDSFFSMTNAERAKLTPSDWARLEAESSL